MFLQILAFNRLSSAEDVLRQLGADPYGVRVMLPKTESVLVMIRRFPSIAANILKQEMLSIGGELAVPRDLLTGKQKHVDCLLISTLAQLKTLQLKLKRQPFGLARLCPQIGTGLSHIRRQRYALKARSRSLALGPRTAVMGVINITDDSLSGDGLLGRTDDPGFLAGRAQEMVRHGADLIDIGAESSRPGAKALPVKEELRRIIPAVRAAVKAVRVPVSADTSKPAVAKACLDAGAAIINDITGMKDPAMRRICSRAKAAVVIMHMRGKPGTMQKNPRYGDLMAELHDFFSCRIQECLEAGISRERIIIDPGIGFGKTIAHNLEILNRLSELKQFGLPLLVGTSRKSFIGKLSGVKEAGLRLHGTTASVIAAAGRGAAVVRVHDVAAASQALAVGQAIDRAAWSS